MKKNTLTFQHNDLWLRLMKMLRTSMDYCGIFITMHVAPVTGARFNNNREWIVYFLLEKFQGVI